MTDTAPGKPWSYGDLHECPASALPHEASTECVTYALKHGDGTYVGRMTHDQALFQRDGYQQAYEQAAAETRRLRARVAELEAGVHAMREAQCGCLGGLGSDL